MLPRTHQTAHQILTQDRDSSLHQKFLLLRDTPVGFLFPLPAEEMAGESSLFFRHCRPTHSLNFPESGSLRNAPEGFFFIDHHGSRQDLDAVVEKERGKGGGGPDEKNKFSPMSSPSSAMALRFWEEGLGLREEPIRKNFNEHLFPPFIHSFNPRASWQR